MHETKAKAKNHVETKTPESVHEWIDFDSKARYKVEGRRSKVHFLNVQPAVTLERGYGQGKTHYAWGHI
jgi:hypothetical protein